MATDNSAAQFFNPNAGKLLGYIYDNSNSRERWSDTKTITIEGGEGSRQETEYAQPDRTVTKHYSDSVAIPIYEPPLKFVWDGKPLTDEQKFNLTAKLAGAGDVESPGKVSGGPGGGTIDSPYVPLEMRQAIGLPRSFDMLTNIDPSKPDWNLQKARLYNPTSKGVLGDFFTDFAVPIQIALTLAGQPQLAGAIRGATQAMNTDGSILKGAAKGYAQGSAAQALTLGMDALGAALDPNIFTTAEAAIDAGTLGGQATGIAGLVNDLSSATGLSPSTLQNMAKGAATSAIKGGDPLEGALSALAVTGATSSISGIDGFSSLDPALQKTILSMASGATKAVVTGADPAQSALQSGLGSLLSSVGKGGFTESSTPTEDWIDKGGLDLGMEYSTPTEMFIDSGDLGGAYSTATEDWIDKAGLTTAFQQPTLEELLNEPTTPTERAIDTGYLGSGTDYATPTESFIDQGGLGAPREYATPTESWIDQGGLGQPLTPADIATPTEEAIDRGTLGGLESTATEDWIDRGGLGGGTGAGPTGGTPAGGGTRPGGTTGGAPAGTPTTTTPVAGAANQGNLLALLGLLGNQQAPSAPQQTPLAEIKAFYDIGSGKYTSGFGTPYAEGGSVRDLMHILRG